MKSLDAYIAAAEEYGAAFHFGFQVMFAARTLCNFCAGDCSYEVL